MAALLLSPSPSYAQTTTPASAGTDLQAIGDASPNPHAIDAQPIDVQTIFHLTNQDRAAQGLPALAWSPELATAATIHAQQMAAAGQLSHRYAGEPDLTTRASQGGAHFSSIAENIALGPRAAQIEQQWMHSPPHRTNILDPRMTAIGIAVTPSNGTLYAVQDFAASVPLLTLDQVEHTVQAELQALQPNRTLPGTAPALFIDASHKSDLRRLCSEQNASSVGQLLYWTAPFEITWQGSDLSLPQALIAAVNRGHYHTAAIGACPATSGAFTVYQVTVVLD